MKISFLLPSKNRLEYLKHAVASVLSQNCADVEIIVSDNASMQDYAGYVAQMREPRPIYRRQPHPVSVTQNWNATLSLATGDYILMLGDDDALTPDFMRRVAAVLRTGDTPDIVYLGAFHYCYPKVLRSAPSGYLASVRNSVFLRGASGPFVLTTDRAQEVAKAALDLRHRFSFNSQHFLFRRGFLEELKSLGGVFQSPYPDTFAAVVSFMKARSIVVVPEPVVMIGISPKSFGYYYFNDLQTEGYAFLDNAEVSAEISKAIENVFLPGDRNNTNWLIAAEAACRALPPGTAGPVNVERYRFLQMIAFLRDVYVKQVRQRSETGVLVERLSQTERWTLRAMIAAIECCEAGGSRAIQRLFERLDQELEQYSPAEVTFVKIGRHANIGDAFHWLQTHPNRRLSTAA